MTPSMRIAVADAHERIIMGIAEPEDYKIVSARTKESHFQHILFFIAFALMFFLF